MIFSTFNQFNCFVIFIFFGIIAGLIYNLFAIIFLLNYSKKIKNLIILTIFYAFFTTFFIILINIFNFGKISFVVILSYILGFIWIKKLFKNKCTWIFFFNVFSHSRERALVSLPLLRRTPILLD